jgi:hypothetical protein
MIRRIAPLRPIIAVVNPGKVHLSNDVTNKIHKMIRREPLGYIGWQQQQLLRIAASIAGSRFHGQSVPYPCWKWEYSDRLLARIIARV